ncbi:MAG: hypothetical protein ACTH0Y_11820 [Luteimonas sp.]
MRTVPRRHPARSWLLGLFAADLGGLAALLLNQWLVQSLLVSWLFAVLLTAASLPWLSRLADALLEVARTAATIPLAGEKNP